MQRALDLGICGMSADDERSIRRVERFAQVPDGSLVWTRDADGEYFVGRLTGPLRQDHTADAVEAGLTEIRPCTWTEQPVPEREVPAATLATFARGGRNFQETHHPDVWAQSVEVWRRRGR
ncbi:MAG: GAF domain-containing protein [Gordonia paraffinivorans]